MTDSFSPSYEIARDRFRKAALACGARLEDVRFDARGPRGDVLSLDVAVLGDRAADAAVVVSSGLHGVEGFFGSAIQLSWLERLSRGGRGLPEGAAAVLLHAVNPFGFAWRRRCDEGNVDLNRNYLSEGEPYRGTPPGYETLHPLLNPPTPPGGFECFRLRALLKIARHGMRALKNTVAVGQYEYPAGLFFGGREPAASTRVVQGNIDRWLGDAREVVHIDLHSGLGDFGGCRLLLPPMEAEERAWYSSVFDPQALEALPDRTAYPARGVMGAWLRRHFADRNYRFVGAEFGTHSILRVLTALRAENRAHHHGRPGESAYERAKEQLLECFCPRSPTWRLRVIEQGLELLERAMTASRGTA